MPTTSALMSISTEAGNDEVHPPGEAICGGVTERERAQAWVDAGTLSGGTSASLCSRAICSLANIQLCFVSLHARYRGAASHMFEIC
jgi:hypothetical protein